MVAKTQDDLAVYQPSVRCGDVNARSRRASWINFNLINASVLVRLLRNVLPAAALSWAVHH
jgi:hypothetical protein